MDIKKISEELEQEDVPVRVPLFKRDGEPDLGSDGQQAYFEMLGRDSARVKRVMEAQQRRWARHRGPIKSEDLYANRVEVATAALVSWGGIEDGGKPVAVSPDVAKAVFSDRHYLEQAEEGIANHARFFTKAS